MRLFQVVSVLAIAVVAQQKCGQDLNKCPESSPCCSEHGYCGTSVAYCGGGCQRPFSQQCLPRPACKSGPLEARNLGKITAKSLKMPSTDLVNDMGFATVSDGVVLKMVSAAGEDSKVVGEGARVVSGMYVHYGRISARVKPSPGTGVVTSFILMADERDEIDFEWLGKNPRVVETNYYYDGILDHTKGERHDLVVDLTQDWHDYVIDWTPHRIRRWSVDGQVVRTVEKKQTVNGTTAYYPSRPARVQMGIWDGGALTQGVREWAGEIDWSSTSEFQASFDGLDVKCFRKKGGSEGDDGEYDDDSIESSAASVQAFWIGLLPLIGL